MIKGRLVSVLFVVGMAAAVLFLREIPLSAQETPSAPVKSKTLASSVPTLKSEETPIEMVKKTMSGEISARGPSGIALVYENNVKKLSSKEMWFPYNDEPKFVGYQSKTDVGEGDTVTVTYEEAQDGSKRILTGIKLDKKYVPPPEEEAEEDEGDEEKEDGKS